MNTEARPARVLRYEDTALRDVETGEVVDEDAGDWNTEGQPKQLRYDRAQPGTVDGRRRR